MGVNDLAEEWRSAPTGPGDEDHQGGLDTAATSLEVAAEECWHFASEPPTEEDADENHCVLVWAPEDDRPACILPYAWTAIAQAAEDEPDSGIRWARIRDVVLLPPE